MIRNIVSYSSFQIHMFWSLLWSVLFLLKKFNLFQTPNSELFNLQFSLAVQIDTSSSSAVCSVSESSCSVETKSILVVLVLLSRVQQLSEFNILLVLRHIDITSRQFFPSLFLCSASFSSRYVCLLYYYLNIKSYLSLDFSYKTCKATAQGFLIVNQILNEYLII